MAGANSNCLTDINFRMLTTTSSTTTSSSTNPYLISHQHVVNSTENNEFSSQQYNTRSVAAVVVQAVESDHYEEDEDDEEYYSEESYLEEEEEEDDSSALEEIDEQDEEEEGEAVVNHQEEAALMPSPIPYLPPIRKTNDSSASLSSSSSSINKLARMNYHQEQKLSKDINEEMMVLLRESAAAAQSTVTVADAVVVVKSNKKSSIIDSDYKTQSSATTDNDAASSSLSTAVTKQHHACEKAPQDEADAGEEQREQDEDDVDEDEEEAMVDIYSNEAHLNNCENLLSIEEAFIEMMQKGVQQYSRPLRHCMMIMPKQHHVMFQNIEKILAISEYQLNQLVSQDDSTLLGMFNTIGKLYENKMRMSCEAFDIYLNGVEKAFDLLHSLMNSSFASTAQNKENFANFLKESQEDIDMDLKTFLLLPLYYVGDIHLCLKKIREGLPSRNSDYICLSSLIESLENYVERSKVILKKYSASSSFESTEPAATHNTTTNNNIYSSKLQYRQSGHKWKRIQALFINDTFLIMSRHLNTEQFNNLNDLNNLAVKCVNVDCIRKLDFNLTNQLEFQLHYAKTASASSKSSLHVVRLRANSVEEKNGWKKLLSQRCSL